MMCNYRFLLRCVPITATFVILSLAVKQPTVVAQTSTSWIGFSGRFEDVDNWSDGVPGPDDQAHFVVGPDPSYSILFSGNQASGAAAFFGDGGLAALRGTDSSANWELGERLDILGFEEFEGPHVSIASMVLSAENIGLDEASIDVLPGGTLVSRSGLHLGDGSALNLMGGMVTFPDQDALSVAPTATTAFDAGTIHFANGLVLGGSTTDIPKRLLDNGDGVIRIRNGQTLSVDQETSLAHELTLEGGTFSTGALSGSSLLRFVRGTFNLMQTDLLVGRTGLFGRVLDVTADQAIQVANDATIDSSGSMNLTSGLFSANASTNEGELHLAGTNSVFGGNTLTNHGFVAGNGRISASLHNGPTGLVSVSNGERLALSGTGNINDGSIAIQDGEILLGQDLTNSGQVNVTNSTLWAGTEVINTLDGIISGEDKAVFRLGGGLANSGMVAFSSAEANLYGPIFNHSSGTVAMAGTTAATFVGDVLNEGIVYVGKDSSALFLGDVSGAGDFSGSGPVEFVAGLSPGNSAAAISFGGDIQLNSSSILEMEIGGYTPGDEYDQINSMGVVALDGTLSVDLISGFAPLAGDSFEIAQAADGIAGSFDAEDLPRLSGGLFWNVNYNDQTVLLEVLAALLGDLDVDGDVDFDDIPPLVLGLSRPEEYENSFGVPPDLHGDTDRDGDLDFDDIPDFVSIIVSGTPSSSLQAVPEPAASALAMIAFVVFAECGWRRWKT